ncbi:hypothetical protein B0T21DRAFT_345525 [Apiosordaria backusii]|uniref:Uncharacterized protein n=1 Tax=Apiosordaria backusii TaxID=314023 RepID=A0AA40K0S2_9PEZI|nr:hypothetical protein B0T21DRAFT_345525 [Apiosordaria backusii]
MLFCCCCCWCYYTTLKIGSDSGPDVCSGDLAVAWAARLVRAQIQNKSGAQGREREAPLLREGFLNRVKKYVDDRSIGDISLQPSVQGTGWGAYHRVHIESGIHTARSEKPHTARPPRNWELANGKEDLPLRVQSGGVPSHFGSRIPFAATASSHGQLCTCTAGPTPTVLAEGTHVPQVARHRPRGTCNGHQKPDRDLTGFESNLTGTCRAPRREFPAEEVRSEVDLNATVVEKKKRVLAPACQVRHQELDT